ncbi:hypothetical protein Emed_002918 [Eimeria media]
MAAAKESPLMLMVQHKPSPRLKAAALDEPSLATAAAKARAAASRKHEQLTQQQQQQQQVEQQEQPRQQQHQQASLALPKRDRAAASLPCGCRSSALSLGGDTIPEQVSPSVS